MNQPIVISKTHKPWVSSYNRHRPVWLNSANHWLNPSLKPEHQVQKLKQAKNGQAWAQPISNNLTKTEVCLPSKKEFQKDYYSSFSKCKSSVFPLPQPNKENKYDTDRVSLLTNPSYNKHIMNQSTSKSFMCRLEP